MATPYGYTSGAGVARGKGEGSVYWDEPVGLWAAAVAPAPVTGRQRREYIRARTRAEPVRRMRQVQVEVARTGDVPTGRVLSVAGWLERDVEPFLKPAAAADYRTSVGRHIVPAIGRRRLDRLTPDDVQAVHRAVLGRGASTTTAAKVHGCGPQAPGGAWPCGRRRGADCPSRRAPVPAHLEAEQVHGGLWLLRPKTRSSWRRVALPPPLTEALAEHIRVHHPARFLFEASPGIPLDPRRDWQEWKDALAAAGLPHVRLHSARHTTATLLLEAGVPLRTAQEILGQTQALTTARYQHPSLSLQAAALAQATSALTLSTSPLARPEPGPV